MTNLVFIENKRVPKDQAKAIKEDLQAYAISVALKFPTVRISDKEKTRVAKSSVRSLFKECNLSTKNLGTLIHDDVIHALEKRYQQLQKNPTHDFLLETVQKIWSLKRQHPRKYNKLFHAIQKQLNSKQKMILSLFLNSKGKSKGHLPTYRMVGKVVKSTKGSIATEVKQIVKSVNKMLRVQKVKRGR